MRSLLLTAAFVGLCLASTSCSREPLGGEQPKTEVYVLVDLSETWHNPASDDRNGRVLAEIGRGIALTGEDVEPPLLVQHRIIGANSLEREPVCDVVYMPSLIVTKSKDPRRITQPRKFADYLIQNCPGVVLAGPEEQRTEVSAALASVADQPTIVGGRRFIIIASDFLEEAVVKAPLKPQALQGASVLMIYRRLVKDQAKPGDMTERVDDWKAELERHGAKVTALPDTGLRGSQIVAFLNAK